MKTLRIEFANVGEFETNLDAVYHILTEVFPSLPRFSILDKFPEDNGASYRIWYEQHFGSFNNFNASGPSLMVGDDYFLHGSTITYRITTPTSGRVVTVTMESNEPHEILFICVEFPGGSIHAARKIWDKLIEFDLRPLLFTASVEIPRPRVLIYDGRMMYYLKPLKLPPFDKNRLDDEFDIEYCISTTTDSHPYFGPYVNEYELRLWMKGDVK